MTPDASLHSIEAYFFRKIRASVIVVLLGLVLAVACSWGLHTHASLRSMCELAKMKTESVRDSLARELVLGNAAYAHDVFQTYQTRLRQVAPMIEPTLVQSGHAAAAAATAAGDFTCNIGMLSATYSMPLSFAGEHVGVIAGTIAAVAGWQFLLIAAGVAALIATLMLRVQAVVRHDLYRTVVEPVQRLAKGESIVRGGVVLREVHAIERDLIHLRQQIAQAERDRCEADKAKSLNLLAAQVAHDIRSPLTALEIVGKSLALLPEETRVIMRNSIQRVKDIANNLLAENRRSRGLDVASLTEEPRAALLVSSLIERLVTEKRMNVRSTMGVEIEAHIDASSYGLFAAIQTSEFARVISNLVNNAVEAVGDVGRVDLILEGGGRDVLIKVRDNGTGIAPDKLAGIGESGVTHDKRGGTGLGLYHARQTLESWGGRLSIDSTVGLGTTVTLRLPTARAPAWFVDRIALRENQKVIILDDDSSIHQVWDGRLLAAGVAVAHDVLHFLTPAHIKIWCEAHPLEAREALFLCDYELLGFDQTGLDLIEELGLENQAILVTSRFEEPILRARCEGLGVRLIPKGLAGAVPIARDGQAGTTKSNPKRRPDAVLVDDEPLNHLVWRASAQRHDKHLDIYKTAAQLDAELDRYDPATPIYVDSNLADGVKGEEYTLALERRGFTELYLATGHDPSRFPTMPHLRGIAGKTPPWEAHVS